MSSTSTEPIIPSFGDVETGRKLAIICSKGNLDMAYPGLILANAALGEGVETHLFFTFWGFDMINKKTMGELKFTMLGNTATHMPQGLGGLPGMTALATHQMRKTIADIGVPTSPSCSSRSSTPAVTCGAAGCPRTCSDWSSTTCSRRSRTSSAPRTSSRRPPVRSCCSCEARRLGLVGLSRAAAPPRRCSAPARRRSC
ncbi:MAG: DsrE/DsrF/DrsH-like family protein [Nocardioidaceae bacterium]